MHDRPTGASLHAVYSGGADRFGAGRVSVIMSTAPFESKSEPGGPTADRVPESGQGHACGVAPDFGSVAPARSPRLAMSGISRMPGRILAGLVRVYQLVLSPAMAPSCRHLPTCSEYAVEALRRHGVLRGGRLVVWRIARCHPFGTSGFDPVPARGEAPRRPSR